MLLRLMKRDFNLIQTFLDKKPLNIDYLFDATINRNSFTIQEIADLSYQCMRRKSYKQIAERKRVKKIADINLIPF